MFKIFLGVSGVQEQTYLRVPALGSTEKMLEPAESPQGSRKPTVPFTGTAGPWPARSLGEAGARAWGRLCHGCCTLSPIPGAHP